VTPDPALPVEPPAAPVTPPVTPPATPPATTPTSTDTQYASVVLENDSDITINYSFQWGDGESADFSLDPGYYRVHYWTYDTPNQNRSPTPQIRFDYDLSNEIVAKSYSLTAYAAPTTEHADGYKYHFRKTGDGALLELFDGEQ
jgi:hypothetical protein